MAERVYTVWELEALRQAVENKWLFGSYTRNSAGFSRSFREPERVFCVEQLVRTHMLAGHTAEDLYESERTVQNNEV